MGFLPNPFDDITSKAAGALTKTVAGALTGTVANVFTGTVASAVTGTVVADALTGTVAGAITGTVAGAITGTVASAFAAQPTLDNSISASPLSSTAGGVVPPLPAPTSIDSSITWKPPTTSTSTTPKFSSTHAPKTSYHHDKSSSTSKYSKTSKSSSTPKSSTKPKSSATHKTGTASSHRAVSSSHTTTYGFEHFVNTASTTRTVASSISKRTSSESLTSTSTHTLVPRSAINKTVTSNGSSIGAIAGGVGGLIVLIFLMVFIGRAHKQKNKANIDLQEFRRTDKETIEDEFKPWSGVYEDIAGVESQSALLSADAPEFLLSPFTVMQNECPPAKSYVGSSISPNQAAPKELPILKGRSGRPPLPHKSDARIYSEGSEDPFADHNSEPPPSLTPGFKIFLKNIHTMNGKDEDAYDGIS